MESTKKYYKEKKSTRKMSGLDNFSGKYPQIFKQEIIAIGNKSFKNTREHFPTNLIGLTLS